MAIDIEDIRRLNVRDGDTIVVQSKREISNEERHHIGLFFKDVIHADCSIVVVGPDVSISVLGPEEVEADGLLEGKADE